MNEGIKSAWINGVCVIAGALIGIFSININLGDNKSDYEALRLENMDLQTQLDELSQKYENLMVTNEDLNSKNSNLQDQINLFADIKIEYESLVEENTMLQDQINILEFKLRLIKNLEENEDKLNDLKENRNNNTYIQITAATVNIRSAPDSSSSVIASTERDTKVLLTNTVTGVDGYEWYEVPVEDQTGYVRSDLAIIVES